MADDVVRVEGLAEFRSALRSASKELPRALTEAHKKIARRIVDLASPRATTKHGKAARSQLAAGASQTGAFVRASGVTAFGDEFGSDRYHQFKPWSGRTGYAIWPTIRDQSEEIGHTYLAAVDEAVTRRAFPQ